MNHPAQLYALAGNVSFSALARRHTSPRRITVPSTAFRTRPARAFALVLRKTARSIAAWMRSALARYQQRQLARAANHALHELDDDTLRDLGFDRSEITSVA